jgi:hypothetical protein
MARVGALLGSFAVLAQWVIMVQQREADLLGNLVRFFGFFTILTNLMVCCQLWVLCLPVPARIKHFFNASRVQTALTIYILLVGLVYNTLLRSLWNPTGLQRVVDELLHTVMPLFMLIFWILFAKKGGLGFRDLLYWSIYPLLYLVYILVKGHFSGYYPYPFLNVEVLGMQRVLFNSFWILGFFMGLTFLLPFLGQKFASNTP